MFDYRQKILSLAAQGPNATAVIDASGPMDRGTLVQRAGGAAVWARKLSGTEGRPPIVALLADPGAAQVAGFLGIGLAGAVVMPLDPTLPTARLQKLLDIAGPAGLITSEGLSSLGAEIAADLPRADLATLPEAPPEVAQIAPDAPAYVMFTSGSTGMPKPVLGRLKSLGHFIDWECRELGLDGTTITAQLAPVTFDVSLRDVLVPLCAGGVVTTPPRDLLAQPGDLLGWFRAHRITLLHMVPSLLRLLTAELAARPVDQRPLPDTLRHLLLAGEPLTGRDIMAWRDVAGTDASVLNLYGPSETVLAKMFYRVPPDARLPEGVLPIGGPLPDTDVLILKPDREAVTGEIGEICIRTAYPSLGYLGDPEATRAVFQRNPFGDQASDIIYRSGDMGRRRPDGLIDCLGRRDGQIKIAGNRIESGEVEAALRACAAVTDAAVVVDLNDAADPFLIGYVAGALDESDIETTLRPALAATLPSYMVPRFIMPLPSLPRLLNGKIDRRALPAPTSVLGSDAAFCAPETDMEKTVAALFSQVLNLKKVSVDAPFASLGGDSLRAIKLLGAIYRETGCELRIAAFLKAATVRGVAQLIETSAPDTQSSAGIPRQPDAEFYPLSDTQEPIWAMQQAGMAASVYTLSYGFRIDGGLDVSRFDRALRGLIDAYEILRTRIVEIDGVPRQVVVSEPDFAIERAVLAKGDDFETAARALLASERERPFDLGNAPLMRAVLADSADAGPILLVLSFHHAICDGASLDLALARLLEAYATDTPPVPPALQYRDAVAWQTDKLGGAGRQRLLDYWQARLADAPDGIDLPEAAPRPDLQRFEGATQSHPLPPALFAGLDQLARDRDSSLFNVLLTGLAVTLDQRADQPDMVIGTPALGRGHPDLADQIGFFANTLCLRVSVDRTTNVAEQLDRITRDTHAALDHQDLPFSRLFAELGRPRDLSRNPLCNVMLVYYDDEPPRFDLPGVGMSRFGSDTEWTFSRFDLVFHVSHVRREGRLVLDLNYDTALFTADQIARIAHHLETVLAQMAEDPMRSLASVNPVAAPDRMALTALDRHAFAAPESTLTGMVAAAAQAAPEAIAVDDGHQQLSHAALQARADGIAAALIAEGIAEGDLVALMGARSAEGVAAILGILKAGAAWVALDERWAKARTESVLAAARPVCVLTAGEQAPDIALAGIPHRLVKELPQSGAPIDRARPGGLAYVVFTSGSTGTPKGVMVRHSAVANMVTQQIKEFGVTKDSRFLQFAAPVFDAHVAELFVGLAGGARVVAPPRAVLENPLALRRCMAQSAITHVTFPPTVLETLGEALPDSLEMLITAGEAISDTLAQRYSGRGWRLMNAYGPAETAVCAAMHTVDAQNQLPGVPIGRPIDGLGLMLWDASGRQVPPGVPGEIVIHGVGLADGYLDAPELTAQAFPKAAVPGGRVYRTGDYGVLRNDGALLFVGRRDGQVKLAGQRLELAEVEARLAEAPDVARAVAGTVESADGRKVLGAWVLKSRGRASLWPSIAEFFVYDDTVYGAMASDRARNVRYMEGFRRHLVGQTVLEVGPGPYLVLSRMAIEAGARHVYAVEINPEIAERARAAAAQAGLSDRITVLTGDAASLELPEPVDWCISEIVGGIGGSEGAAAILNGVRQHLRQPENMLPRSSVTRIAALSLPRNAIEPGFDPVAADYVERIFDQRGRPFDLRLCLRRLDRDRLLSDSAPFEALDFTREMALESDHEITLKVLRDGPMTGFALWLTLDVGASRLIDVMSDSASWLPVYVPLPDDNPDLRVGDVICANVSRRLTSSGRHPDFAISGEIQRNGQKIAAFTVEIPHESASFGDSPLHDHLFDETGAPRSVADDFTKCLRDHAAQHLPRYAVPALIREVDTLPRTVNGKIALDELPDLSGLLRAAPAAQTDDPLVQAIATKLGEVLGGAPLDPKAGFFEQGGDSISAVRAVGALVAAGIELTAAEIMQHQSAVALAAVARQSTGQGLQAAEGAVPAHPVQAWYLSRDPDLSQRFHQSVLVDLPHGTTSEQVETALSHLTARHDALRLRLDPATAELMLCEDADVSPLLPLCDLRAMPQQQAAIRRAEAAEETHARIAPRHGPVLMGRVLREDAGDRLLLVAHHLSVDMVSWRLLLEDLAALLANPETLPDVMAPGYRDICAALAREAQSPATSTEKPYWDMIERRRAQLKLPLEGVGPGPVQTLRLDLGHADVSFDTGDGERCQARLLWALADAAQAVFDWPEVVVDLETHGRDLPRTLPNAAATVGWLTRITPVLVTAGGISDPLADLVRGGLGHGLLAWMRPDGVSLRATQSPIALNHLGRLASGADQGGLRIDWDGLGSGIDTALRTGHALAVLSHQDEQGGLFLSLSFDPALIAPNLAHRFGDALQQSLKDADKEFDATNAKDIDMEALAADLGL